MRRIVVTAIGLCVVVGCIAAVVHGQDRALADRLKNMQSQGTETPSATVPATFQPQDSRPVPTPADSPKLRSVLKRIPVPIAARPIEQETRPDTKSSFGTGSLQDYPSSRRTARRNDGPRFVRPRTSTAEAQSQGTTTTPPRVKINDTNNNASVDTGSQINPVPRQAPQVSSPRDPAPRALPSNSSRRLEATTMISQMPQLELSVETPRKIRFGKPAQYRIKITNHGKSPVDSVFVRVRMPKWVEVSGQRASVGAIQANGDDTGERQFIWDIQQMGALRTEKLELDLAPTRDQEFQVDVDWAVRPNSVSAKILVLKPELKLVISGPKDLEYGKSGVFSITVSNPGSGDAENILLNVQPGGAQPRRIPRLSAGQQMDMEVELTARQAGLMTIRATAIADDALRAEQTQQVEVRRAQLVLRASAPDLIFAGSVAKVRIDVANDGNAVARNVYASLQLPTGAKYVAGLGNASVEQGRLNWSVGDLAPGNQRSFEMQCQVNLPGKSQFSVRLSDQQGNSAIDTAISRVEALADLKLTVNDPKGPRAVGETVEYEIEVFNRGTKAAQVVKLVAHFSKGIEPIKLHGIDGRILPGQVLFNDIPRVEANQRIKVRVTARATQAGSHNIRAELLCQDPETKLVSQESTRFFGDSASGSTTSSTANQPSTGTPTPVNR